MLLSEEIKKRILILDGAMGTMLQKRGMQGNSENFNLSRPDDILEIHKEYIRAGADIIESNTFSANRISQAEYGLSDQAHTLAEAGVAIARKAADSASRKVWVAGSMGPTGKSLSLAQNIDNPSFRQYSFDEMSAAYSEQADALIKGGADFLLLETCFDALNTKAAIYAIRKLSGDITIAVSVSASDKSGRTLTGQTIEAFYRSVSHAGLLAFGLNCSLGAKDLSPLVEEASRWACCPIICYPNAGLPNEMGEYDETPAEMAAAVRALALSGNINIVGGCCGTTPEHISAIMEAVRDCEPHSIPVHSGLLHVSGLESVTVDKAENNFTNIGERTNVAGSKKFARLISGGDYESALQVAANQIEGGASIIDVNMDDAMLDPEREMTTFLRYISGDPAVAKAAIMIDSSHWETIVAGMKNAQGKCIVNSISLKEGEHKFLEKAAEIKALGGAAVVIAFDEEGQAATFDRKIEICRRAYSLLLGKAHFSPSDIIFDVNVLPIGTGIPEHSKYAVDFIEAVRWIKKNLPGALTSGGISNLSFSFRGNNKVREAMHSVFLYHAINAGLDMGIVNPGMLSVYDEIEPELLRCVEDVILDKDSEATERLIAKANLLLNTNYNDKNADEASAGKAGPQQKTVEERLAEAVVKGGSPTLETDILEALQKHGKAVDIIEGPLMDGMEKVGKLFGSGKMFLPQVVKSAKVMKTAVSLLEPYMEGTEDSADGSDSAKKAKPSIVMATVKGDVHDIGKNITGIVMTCNGIEVTDLGVMVPKEEILEKAAGIHADLIGVSGLITPSLYQMEELCKQMSSMNMSTPLIVGGAAASALHTAVKLAPLYDHVFYGNDASSSAVLANRLVSDRDATEKAEHEQQRRLRELYEQSHHERNAAGPEKYPAETYLQGSILPSIEARELSLDELLPFFDWELFLTIWGIKSPAKADEKQAGRVYRAIRKLRNDAESEIEKMKSCGSITTTLCARFDAAHSEKENIVAKDFTMPMMRQPGGHSLSDFVAPAEYGTESLMGMFAVSVRSTAGTAHKSGCTCAACSNNEYSSMLERSIRLALAEAASCWLDNWMQEQLRQKGSDTAPDGRPVKIIKPAVGYASCPDHTLKRDILALLPQSGKLGISLLDSCTMVPDSTICGLVFVHPDAFYPDIRRIGKDAVDEYAALRRFSDKEKSVFLGHLL